MKFLSYIKYFYFLFINWDIRIAWVMIWQEVKGEKNTTSIPPVQMNYIKWKNRV